MRKSLDEIALTAGAGGDKASDRHNYCVHYESVFEPFRDKFIRLLEIGIGEGSSMKIWLEYFPNAIVHGVDIDQKPNFGSIRQFSKQGDQNDESFWMWYNQDNGFRWDIVIDDGSHKTNGIVTSFKALWPSLKSGGFYCIEDLRCSYMVGYQVEGWGRQMDFIKDLLDCVNFQCKYVTGLDKLDYPPGVQDLGIEWIRFSEELAIIKKK